MSEVHLIYLKRFRGMLKEFSYPNLYQNLSISATFHQPECVGVYACGFCEIVNMLPDGQFDYERNDLRFEQYVCG